MARQMRQQAQAWPRQLVPIPETEWPPPTATAAYPIAAWRSRDYLVQQYAEEPFRGIEVRRLTVNRVTIEVSGHWEHNIAWDDLQRCKRETGHGDWYGVEIYPRDRDVVHECNIRHLWLLAEPLSIGWFEE
jgi:hypothetical protein